MKKKPQVTAARLLGVLGDINENHDMPTSDSIEKALQKLDSLISDYQVTGGKVYVTPKPEGNQDAFEAQLTGDPILKISLEGRDEDGRYVFTTVDALAAADAAEAADDLGE